MTKRPQQTQQQIGCIRFSSAGMIRQADKDRMEKATNEGGDAKEA
jgi:hypothetical protein